MVGGIVGDPLRAVGGMKTKPPPVKPGQMLRYVERTCTACGNVFEEVWAPHRKPRRLCKQCRRKG